MDTIEDLESKLLSSPNSIPLLTKLMKFLIATDETVRLCAIEAIDRVIVNFIKENYFLILGEEVSLSKKEKKSPGMMKVQKWLEKQYEVCIKALLKNLKSKNENIQVASFDALMNWERSHCKAKIKYLQKVNILLRVEADDIYPKIVNIILSHNHLSEKLNKAFIEYLNFDDLGYYFLSTTLNALTKSNSPSQVILKNSYALLKSLKLYNKKVLVLLKNPKEARKELDSSTNNSKKRTHEQMENQFITATDYHIKEKQIYQKCWIALLKNPNTPDEIVMETLQNIREILTNSQEPVLFMDYLVDISNEKGLKSVFSLIGLLELMTKHNLDYPDFFQKVYSFLEPSIIHSEHLPRFFHLMDVLFKSQLLPGYIVAAFIKKLLRLSLIAPANITMLILTIIHNILIKHSSVRHMFHKGLEDETSEVLNLEKQFKEDPFKPNEKDLKLCKAIDSSAWEILALMNHFIPPVAGFASTFKSRITQATPPKSTHDYENYTYKDIFDHDVSKRVRQGTPTNYERPLTILKPNYFPAWSTESQQNVNDDE